MEFVYAYFFFIETKGRNGPLSLEEIAALFEDRNELDRIIAVNQTEIPHQLSGDGIGDDKTHDAQVDKV